MRLEPCSFKKKSTWDARCICVSRPQFIVVVRVLLCDGGRSGEHGDDDHVQLEVVLMPVSSKIEDNNSHH